MPDRMPDSWPGRMPCPDARKTFCVTIYHTHTNLHVMVPDVRQSFDEILIWQLQPGNPTEKLEGETEVGPAGSLKMARTILASLTESCCLQVRFKK